VQHGSWQNLAARSYYCGMCWVTIDRPSEFCSAGVTEDYNNETTRWWLTGASVQRERVWSFSLIKVSSAPVEHCTIQVEWSDNLNWTAAWRTGCSV